MTPMHFQIRIFNQGNLHFHQGNQISEIYPYGQYLSQPCIIKKLQSQNLHFSQPCIIKKLQSQNLQMYGKYIERLILVPISG